MTPSSKNNFLPQKKLPVALTAIAAVIVIGFIVFWQTPPGDKNSNNTSRELSVASESSTEFEEDADGDGLKDWEELLWATDPEVADSDGDGTDDGAEVEANRNPAIAGPDDALDNSKSASSSQDAIISAKTNPNFSDEDLAAQNFFARFLSLRQSGNLNAKTAKELGESYNQEMIKEPIELNFNKYTSDDIIISENSSDSSLKRYGNDMGAVILRYPPVSGTTTELQIYVSALNNNQESMYEKIDPYIKRYEDLIAGSLKVSVPEAAVETHLNYINALHALKKNAEAMREGYKNPVRSSFYISRYVEEQEAKVVSSVLGIERFFKNRNITFNSSEPGAMFANVTPHSN